MVDASTQALVSVMQSGSILHTQRAELPVAAQAWRVAQGCGEVHWPSRQVSTMSPEHR